MRRQNCPCYYEFNSQIWRCSVKRDAEIADTVCPVARSLDIVGDRWTLLILRELFMGATRFEEIQIQTKATPQMLATRLKAMEAGGLIERHPYSQKPLRHEYRLTEKGRAFYPVIYALRAWGETCPRARKKRLPYVLPIVSAGTTLVWGLRAQTVAYTLSVKIWKQE